jgi:hypothetical protein
MTQTQLFKAGKPIAIGLFCLLLPWILNISKNNVKLFSFEGSILRTEFKEAPKEERTLSRIKDALLKDKADYFWIYIGTGDGETAFLVQTYPDITARLNTLKQGDLVKIKAEKDDMGRGHYFPRLIQRDGDIVFQAAQLETYESKKVRFLYYAGAVILAWGVIELIYYHLKDKRNDSIKDFTKPM